MGVQDKTCLPLLQVAHNSKLSKCPPSQLSLRCSRWTSPSFDRVRRWLLLHTMRPLRRGPRTSVTCCAYPHNDVTNYTTCKKTLVCYLLHVQQISPLFALLLPDRCTAFVLSLAECRSSRTYTGSQRLMGYFTELQTHR